MSNDPVYKPTEHEPRLTPDMMAYFDGSHLEEHLGEAICLTTAGEDGWPHAALLSVGEILAAGTDEIRFAISPNSTTTRNIERSGRLAMTLVHGGKLLELRLKARRIGTSEIGHNTALFSSAVELVRVHSVPYAELLSGVTYRLNDVASVTNRWKKQIEALRTAA